MRDGRATYRLWRVRARVAFLSSRAPVARTGASAHYSRWWALSARLPEVLELPERLRVGCGGACHRIVSEDELRAVAPIVPQYRGGFVSSCGWLRHRPGGVGLRSERPGITGATSPSMSWDPWPRPVARAAVGMQECTQIGENGLSTQPPPACRMRPLVRPTRKVRLSVTSPAQSAPFGHVAVASPAQSALFREPAGAECAFT